MTVIVLFMDASGGMPAVLFVLGQHKCCQSASTDCITAFQDILDPVSDHCLQPCATL